MFVLDVKRIVLVVALALLAVLALQMMVDVDLLNTAQEFASRWGVGAGSPTPGDAGFASRWGVGFGSTTEGMNIASRWSIGAG